MVIRLEHNFGKDGAIRRIKDQISRLLKQSFPGVTINDPQYGWAGSTLNFSFKAKKGLFSQTIRGTVEVLDKVIVITSDLPSMVKTFVGEDKVESVIKAEFQKIFA